MKRRSTRENLRSAALRVAARDGARNASVRSIARLAGVTETALYRHFRSKDALYREIYASVIEDMAVEKRSLLRIRATAAAKIHEWVRLTYDYFDRNTEAFTYALLDDSPTIKPVSEPGLQSTMFMELLRDAHERAEARDIDPALAAALFAGMLLYVPRLINLKRLPGPASRHSDAVADAACRVLLVDPAGAAP